MPSSEAYTLIRSNCHQFASCLPHCPASPSGPGGVRRLPAQPRSQAPSPGRSLGSSPTWDSQRARSQQTQTRRSLGWSGDHAWSSLETLICLGVNPLGNHHLFSTYLFSTCCKDTCQPWPCPQPGLRESFWVEGSGLAGETPGPFRRCPISEEAAEGWGLALLTMASLPLT